MPSAKGKTSNNISGQAVLEYILLMACLSVLAIGFAKFASSMIFTGPLENGLPGKVGICVSHGKTAEGKCR
jgi:hypothetical protein